MRSRISRGVALVVLMLITACSNASCSKRGGEPPSRIAHSERDCDGREVLLRSAEAYRRMPSLDETWKARIEIPGAPPKEEILEYGFRGSDAYLRMPGLLRIERTDGRLLIAEDGAGAGKPVVIESGEGTLQQRIDRAFGQQGPPLVPQPLLLRDAPPSSILDAFRMKLLSAPRIAGCRVDSLGVRTVSLSADNGEVDLSIEGTGRIASIAAEIDPGGGNRIKASVLFQPAAPPADPFPLTRMAASARPVETVAELFSSRPPAVVEGSLTAADGRRVDVKDLRGSIVVIEFFATWCAPCRMTLPAFERFAQRARKEGVPVKTFVVNTQEGAPSREETIARVRRFLEQASVNVPVLYDLDGTLHRSVGGGLPLTVIVDAEGRIDQTHGGFDPGMEAALRRRVRDLSR